MVRLLALRPRMPSSIRVLAEILPDNGLKVLAVHACCLSETNPGVVKLGLVCGFSADSLHFFGESFTDLFECDEPLGGVALGVEKIKEHGELVVHSVS